MQYWLFKTEPDEFSIEDLAAVEQEIWDGIRNYQARNFLRDKVAMGDKVFIYHSSCKQPGIAGIASVSQTAIADPTQFDSNSKYYDPKSSEADPRWHTVALKFVKKVKFIRLATLKDDSQLEDMHLVKKGSRLSIQPVTEDEWKYIIKTYS